MMPKTPLLPALVIALLLALPAQAEDVTTPGPAPAPEAGPPLDLVLCLDTSGSMQGLIDAAREKLWSVVSELATAQPMPHLRVALLTYGSPGNDHAGHVVLQTDLTEDLDLVSERLFALGTNGGDEYVGRVVAHALDRLAWGPRDGLRIVFVAGNEGADQDPATDFRAEARRAVAMGAVVNAIYCGNPDDGVAAGWRELAAQGQGRYAHIDHNAGTVSIETPFDEELARLSRALNDTYVAYGEGADAARARQEAQDRNAEAAGAPAAAERAATKAGRLYRNAGWDLVDKLDEEGFDLASVPEEQLPEALRTMSLEERRAWLEERRAMRETIQTEIEMLTTKREAYVASERARLALDDDEALDRALKDAIREQAGAKGLRFTD